MRAAHRPAPGDARVEAWTPRTLAAHLEDAMHIYARAMRYPEYSGAQRGARQQGVEQRQGQQIPLVPQIRKA